MTFTRITVDPTVMAGVPTVRGLRIPVATIVAMVADGLTPEEILRDLPDLEAADITESLRFAAEVLRERHLPLQPSACSSSSITTSALSADTYFGTLLARGGVAEPSLS